jgi:hypothetical protein
LIAENARLNDLLDNRDDLLRKTNKEKRELRTMCGSKTGGWSLPGVMSD